jgi:hypothetical protein
VDQRSSLEAKSDVSFLRNSSVLTELTVPLELFLLKLFRMKGGFVIIRVEKSPIYWDIKPYSPLKFTRKVG